MNYNMHCHLLSSCCLLVIVMAALHRSISSCKSLPTTSNLYFRWSRWYYPLFKVKHWGSKRSSTYAKIIESLNLNPVIPVSKTHIPFTVLVTSLHCAWNRKAPLPGECYTREQGWFVFVRLCLSLSCFKHSTNIYWMLYCLQAVCRVLRTKQWAKTLRNSCGPLESLPSSLLTDSRKMVLLAFVSFQAISTTWSLPSSKLMV